MRVLDLFCGLKGWSKAFADRGHTVVTLDIEAKFKPDIVADILTWDPSTVGPIDVVLASPPCEKFSVMNIGKNWYLDGRPKTEGAETALAIVARTREVINRINPAVFVIENPRAKLRKLSVMSGLPRVSVSYCRYGMETMKPTDLWGRFPAGWVPRPMCENGNGDHTPAPRGSMTGTQKKKMGPAAALVPYELALEICLASEAALGSPGTPGAVVKRAGPRQTVLAG